MRFRIDRRALADAVGWAARALPARPPLPVLGGLLLEAADGRLGISGYDHEVATSIGIAADVTTAGSALVMGRRLLDVCQVLPDGTVECAVEAPRFTVAGGGVRFGLATLPLEDYPALPALPQVLGSLDAGAFAGAVAQVAVAAGRDDTLPVLTGIRLDLDGDTMTLAATDRYRFAVRSLRWKPEMPGARAEVVVPARRLLEAGRALAGAGVVRLALGEGSLGFEGADQRITMRLLEGRLPHHTALFSMGEPAAGVAERRSLAEAVKRVAVVAEQHSPVRLSFTADSVLLTAGTGDDDTASQRLPATLEGVAETAVALNPAYLADALASLDAPYVEFSLLGPGQRVLLTGRPAEGGEADLTYRHLLISMRTPA